MRLGVTGPDGFLAWHVRAAWLALSGEECVLINRQHFADEAAMDVALDGVDVVLHLAGVNRAGSDSEVLDGNVSAAASLAAGLERATRPIAVVFANSIHATGDSAFGEAKSRSAEMLGNAARTSGSTFADVLLPNIFGEHGRPHYNSFVATFCQQIVDGVEPQLVNDRVLPMLHAQDAVDVLLGLAASGAGGQVVPQGTSVAISEILARLRRIAADYQSGILPDLSDKLERDLFNTFCSYSFLKVPAIQMTLHTDERGGLAEAVRAHGGQTQVFFSTTLPGKTRGQHFHRRKVERFMVVQGSGEIRLRRLFFDEITSVRVSGDEPMVVDMPTMWSHSITNVGTEPLITLFYADEMLDPSATDTYAERV